MTIWIKSAVAAKKKADNAQADRDMFRPINFTSVFNEISKDKLDIIRGTNGKLMLKFGNSDSRVDLSAPVVSRGVNTQLPRINPASEHAAAVVALSQSMTRLNGAIDTMEKTHPHLIEQNKGLLDSFRNESQRAIERGFDFKQYAIDNRLAKMGLSNSSTAFGVQVALAREKSNAYSTLALEHANLSQNLKQQSITNLQQQSALVGQNANVEQNRFNAENQTHLANQGLEQERALSERKLEASNEEQRLSTEFANRNLTDQRQARLAELGFKSMETANNQALDARKIDEEVKSAEANRRLENFKAKKPNAGADIGRKLISTAATTVAAGPIAGAANFVSNLFK